jgi:hypothetical protein
MNVLHKFSSVAQHSGGPSIDDSTSVCDRHMSSSDAHIDARRRGVELRVCARKASTTPPTPCFVKATRATFYFYIDVSSKSGVFERRVDNRFIIMLRFVMQICIQML